MSNFLKRWYSREVKRWRERADQHYLARLMATKGADDSVLASQIVRILKQERRWYRYLWQAVNYWYRFIRKIASWYPQEPAKELAHEKPEEEQPGQEGVDRKPEPV